MKTLEQLKSHTYLDKNGNPIKNPRIQYKQVLEAYSFLINNSRDGKVSTRLLRLAFTDKANTFTKILLQTEYIKLKGLSRSIKISLTDSNDKWLRLSPQYTCSNEVTDIKGNIYIERLIKKLKQPKNNKYQYILDAISDTLSRTTLNGESIDTNFTYKKGRYYGAWTTMSKETRKKLRIDNTKTLSYDIKSSVIQLLSYNKIDGIIPMDNISDFYGEIESKFGLKKEDIIRNIFCHPKQQDKKLDYYPFFLTLRGFKYEFGYKTVHTIYQMLETELMGRIYETLTLNNIDFLPMHDAFIFKQTDYSNVGILLAEITNVKFKLEY